MATAKYVYSLFCGCFILTWAYAPTRLRTAGAPRSDTALADQDCELFVRLRALLEQCRASIERLGLNVDRDVLEEISQLVIQRDTLVQRFELEGWFDDTSPKQDVIDRIRAAWNSRSKKFWRGSSAKKEFAGYVLRELHAAGDDVGRVLRAQITVLSAAAGEEGDRRSGLLASLLTTRLLQSPSPATKVLRIKHLLWRSLHSDLHKEVLLKFRDQAAEATVTELYNVRSGGTFKTTLTSSDSCLMTSRSLMFIALLGPSTANPLGGYSSVCPRNLISFRLPYFSKKSRKLGPMLFPLAKGPFPKYSWDFTKGEWLH